MIKQPKRQAKFITNPKDLEYLFSLNEDLACRTSTMMECFGKFGDKRRFNPYDIISVPPNTFGLEGHKNKKGFMTTVGLWLFNKAFTECGVFPVTGYVNDTIGKKLFKKLNKQISYAVMEDKLDLEELKKYTVKSQKFQPYCNILSPSLSEGLLGMSAEIKKEKETLIKQNKEILEGEPDPAVVQSIEGKLIKSIDEKLKDDPSSDILNSSVGADKGNNLKNMFIMKGISKLADQSRGKYSILTGNYMDGVSKEEYADFCETLTLGPFSRANKTMVGGYWEKLFVKGLEHLSIQFDEDCHTKRYKLVDLTGDNIDLWMYSNIIEGNKLVELNPSNMDKYIGKQIKVRFSGFCECDHGICEACAGSLFRRLNIKHVGVVAYRLPSDLKNTSMKSFHDATVKSSHMKDYGYKKIFGI